MKGAAEAARNLPGLAARVLRARPAKLSPLATVRHSITRYRICLEVFQTTVRKPGPPVDNARWLTLAELEALPFTSAHRKVLRALAGAQLRVTAGARPVATRGGG